MNVLKLAAFSQHGQGGNPAGVAFYDEMPAESEMLAIAKEADYSETAFLVRQNDGWRVRYFAPEMEVPFRGHATIALGAALGVPSRLTVTFTPTAGESVSVSGEVRQIE